MHSESRSWQRQVSKGTGRMQAGQSREKYNLLHKEDSQDMERKLLEQGTMV